MTVRQYAGSPLLAVLIFLAQVGLHVIRDPVLEAVEVGGAAGRSQFVHARLREVLVSAAQFLGHLDVFDFGVEAQRGKDRGGEVIP